MLIDRTRITFWFDGVSSDELGIVVANFPIFTGAEQKVAKYSIPGRNGDLTYWDGTYKNVSAELKCYVVNASKVEDALAAVNNWLADSGYKKFVISSELGRYRMARITNAAEIGIRMGVIAPFTLKFDCKPQRFYDDDKPRVFGTSGTITNQTRFNALPLMRCIWGSGAGRGGTEEIKFTYAESSCRILINTIKTIPSFVDVDLESRRAVSDLGEDIALYFEGGYPVFGKGETTFTLTNSLAGTNWFSGVELYPRWWTL